MSETYKCAACGETFSKGWSEAEAIDELNDNFPGFTTDECDIVCDDCYKKMGFG